ncbi:substrate-binding periplasmic protein [Pseudomonas mangiferae]|nr:transporter substrate-binding domain-containing protein [Pseudomonas mangiferae]
MAFGWANLGTAETLRLVNDLWPPFTDTSLPHGGLATDLVSHALQRAGYTTEAIQVPWARVLRGLQAGDYDVVIAAWKDSERARYGLFSAPYMTNRIRFYQRRNGGIAFDQLADLRTYSIAVVRGYAYREDFDRDDSLLKVPVVDFAMGARMLAAGRLELALEDEQVARYHLGRELRGIGDQLEPLPKPLSENGLHILVRNSHPQARRIVERFDQALQDMRADGSYAAIFKAHGLTPD